MRRIRFVHHAPHARSHVAAWPQCDQPRSRVVDRAVGAPKSLFPAARAWSMARAGAAQARRPACAWRGILNHPHLAWRYGFVGMAAASRVFASTSAIRCLAAGGTRQWERELLEFCSRRPRAFYGSTAAKARPG